MTTLATRVREFHLRFGHPVRDIPTIPTDDDMRFRAKLVTEEFLEFLSAMGFYTPPVARHLREMIEKEPIDVDFPELADALFDLDFVVEGTRTECGIDREPLEEEGHQTNMKKEPNPSGGRSKPIKPYDWVPPNMAKCLMDQGWKGRG